MSTILLITTFLAIGLPVTALCRRDPESAGWIVLGLEAVLFGLVIVWLGAAATVVFGGLRLEVVVGLAAGAAVGMGMAALRRGTIRPGWPARPGESLATAGVVAAAIALRVPAVPYLYGAHPIGHHLADAHRVAAGQLPTPDLPAGLTVLLAVSERLVGDPMAVVPALGVVTFGMLVAAAWQLTLAPAVRVGLAGVLAVTAPAAWLARLPLADDLVACLVAGGIYLTLRATRTGDPWLGGTAGFLFGSAALAGTTAVVPLAVALSLPIVAALSWTPARRTVARAVAVGAGAGGWVGLAVHGALSPTWVAAGLGRLPTLVEAAARSFELASGSMASVAVTLVALAALLASATALAGWRDAHPSAARWLPEAALGALLVAWLATADLGALLAIAHTTGPLVLVLATLGLVAMFAGPGADVHPAAWIGAAFVTLGAIVVGAGFPQPPGPFALMGLHVGVATVLPGAVLLACIGGHAAWTLAGTLGRPGPMLAPALAAGALVAGGAAAMDGWRGLRTDVPDARGALDALHRAASSGGRPLVLSGLHDLPAGWPRPNTWTVLVPPLETAYGHRFLNIAGRDPTAADPSPAPFETRALLRSADVAEALVLVVRSGGLPACDPFDDELATVTLDVPVDHPSRPDPPWITLQVDVCLVRSAP